MRYDVKRILMFLMMLGLIFLMLVLAYFDFTDTNMKNENIECMNMCSKYGYLLKVTNYSNCKC